MMSLLFYMYRNGLWISIPLFLLGVALLVYFILNAVKVVREAHVLSVPLLQE